jgi:hypothetical protein
MWADDSDFFLRLFASGFAALLFVVSVTCLFALRDYEGAAAVGGGVMLNIILALGAHRRLRKKAADRATLKTEEDKRPRDWMGNLRE